MLNPIRTVRCSCLCLLFSVRLSAPRQLPGTRYQVSVPDTGRYLNSNWFLVMSMSSQDFSRMQALAESLKAWMISIILSSESVVMSSRDLLMGLKVMMFLVASLALVAMIS